MPLHHIDEQSPKDALDIHERSKVGGPQMNVDVDAQHRFFNNSKYGTSPFTPLVGFFSATQLEEGLMQAAPAHEDCLELPSERPDLDDVVEESASPKSIKLPVFLPAELQFQIIDHYSEAPTPTGCGFCHLFSLYTACRVSKLWYHYAMKKLYSTIYLNMSMPCEKHYHISSKIVQMEKRIPLLVRTLQSRPNLADMIRRIQFPAASPSANAPGALSYWVTCALEKKWLPSLIRACGKLEAVEGLEDILSQLFKEHWMCSIDSDGDEDHGYLAQSLIEKTTLKEWTWGTGNLEMLGDRVAGKYGTFEECHRNWENLERLSIIGLQAVTPYLIFDACDKLPSLKQLTIKFGDTQRVYLDDYIDIILHFLPERIEKVTFLETLTVQSMGAILDRVDRRISYQISEGLPYYQPMGVFTETLIAKRAAPLSILGMEISFQVDEGNYSQFWEAYAKRVHCQYSRVTVSDTATAKTITISF